MVSMDFRLENQPDHPIYNPKPTPTPHQISSSPSPQIPKILTQPCGFRSESKNTFSPLKTKTPQNPRPQNKKNKKWLPTPIDSQSLRFTACRLVSQLVFARGAKVGSFPPNPVLFATPQHKKITPHIRGVTRGYKNLTFLN